MAGATLATLRLHVRDELKDPEPQRKPDASTSFIHDGGDDEDDFFEDSGEDFVVDHGIILGDVIFNQTKGGSLAVIEAIQDGGGTNARLVVNGNINGGTAQEYDNGDVIYLYDRYAQAGFNKMRYTNTEIDRALNRMQIKLANAFGGIQAFETDYDLVVMTKINVDSLSGILSSDTTITGANHAYTATIEYVASDFLVISGPTGVFENDEVLTATPSGGTCNLNEPSGYTTNNRWVGKAVPTGYKSLIAARFWDGTTFFPLEKVDIFSVLQRGLAAGDPEEIAIWNRKLWLAPQRATASVNALEMAFYSWATALATTTQTTDWEQEYQEVLVKESAALCAGWHNNKELSDKLLAEVKGIKEELAASLQFFGG